MRAPLAMISLALLVTAAVPAGAEGAFPAGKFHVTDTRLPVVASAMAWTGEVAYLFGGGQYLGSNGADTISRYDPTSDTFTLLETRLPNATQGGTAVFVAGAIYLFDLQWMDCPEDYCLWVRDPHVYRFDPKTELLEATAAPLPPGFPVGTRGVALGDLVYFLGGGTRDEDAVDTIWTYTPASDRFDLSGTRLPARTARALAASDGRAIYLFGGIGGFPGGAPGSRYSHDIVRFDPTSGTAEALAVTLPWAGDALQWPGVSWDGQRFLVVPGNGAQPVWFDPASGTVTPLGYGLPMERSATRIIHSAGTFTFLGGSACATDDHSVLHFKPDGQPSAQNRAPTLNAVLSLFAGRLSIDLCGARDPDGVVVATGQEGQPGSLPQRMVGGMTAQTLPAGTHRIAIWAEDEQGARRWANVTVLVGGEADFVVLEEGCTVTATSATVGRNPGTAVKATWDWGDGQPASAVNDSDPQGNPASPAANHTYGRENVTLRLDLEVGAIQTSASVRLGMAGCAKAAAPPPAPTPSTQPPTSANDPTAGPPSSGAPAGSWLWVATLLPFAAARRRQTGRA